MSFEDSVLLQLMKAVNAVQLDAIVIGNAAAALHGPPITTPDIDLFVRGTPRNAEKIELLVETMGSHVVASRSFEPTSGMIRIEGLPVDVDFVFELSSHAKFESVRARSTTIIIEDVPIRLSGLQDVIDAKRAATRPKDHAVLNVLEEFLRIRQSMEEEEPDFTE